MSATLVEFASPLVEVGDDVPTDDLRDLLESVAMLWNAFDPEPALGDGFSDVVRAEFRSRLDGRSANTLLVLEQRRRDLFGDDPRSVGLPAVTVTDGDVVTSVTVPVLDTPRLRSYLDGPEPPDKRAGLAPQYAEILRHHRLDHRFVLHSIPNPLPGADEFPPTPRPPRMAGGGGGLGRAGTHGTHARRRCASA